VSVWHLAELKKGTFPEYHWAPFLLLTLESVTPVLLRVTGAILFS
jgi:hypothetical protein